MKRWIVLRLIDICCKNALKYDLRTDMLLKCDGIDLLYAIGSNVVQRDKWIRRIKWLLNWINK